MKYRILVVDDEEDVRTLLLGTLEPTYEVVQAVNGLDALEKLDRYEPDFVCLDVMMPLMDGFQACDAIRKDQKYRDIPVMFLTASSERDKIKKGYELGANLYLTKPFDPQRLLKNIDVHLGTAHPPRTKKLTIDQIREIESSDAEPVSPGSSAFVEVPREIANPDAPSQVAPQRLSGMETVKLKGQGTPRSMIVDDDPDILEMVETTLEGMTEVVRASDGIEAVEKLVRYQPDVLIIDIMLPKINGFQLIQTIRQNRAFRELPILVCSAKCSQRDQEFAKRIGANSFLPKPFGSDDMIQRIQQLIALPEFRIRPKALTIEEIKKIEQPPPQDLFNATDEIDGRDPDAYSSAHAELQHMVDKSNEPVKEAPLGKPVKDKKRSILRFGKKG